MKTRGGTYNTNNIDTPPLDSHFNRRSNALRLLLPVDGVSDDVVESTMVHELTVKETRTISDGTAQNDATDNATTTPIKSNQQSVEEKEVEPASIPEQVESELKQDVSKADASSAISGGNDMDVTTTWMLLLRWMGTTKTFPRPRKTNNPANDVSNDPTSTTI